MNTIEEQVSMMWGQEVYRTLNEAGLLVRESSIPAYRKAGVVDDKPTFWNLRAVWDGVTPITDWITYSIDADVKRWVYTLKQTIIPNRRFEKAWPDSRHSVAQRTATMLAKFGLTQGITVSLNPAILTELPT